MKNQFSVKLWRRIIFIWGITALSISGCAPVLPTPEATGVASPEAVALSLSTVDPEESLYLFEYDREAPIIIQEVERWHENNAEWIDFIYDSPMGGPVEARLIIPDGKGPFPGMILMHGGSGAATLEDMRYFAMEFVRHGAVTIMITGPYRRPGGWVPTPYMGNTWPLFTEADLRIKIQLIQDLRRAIDILESRPEVDPDRMAYFGVSYGGMMGGLLAGVEDRLVAYVLVVGDGGLVEHTSDPGPDGLNIHFSENWAALMWPTEPLHFVGRAAPAALLFQNGINDMHVPAHDALRFYTAASEPKTMMWYDAGHGLPWQFVNDAAEWLQPYLGDKLLLLAPNYRSLAVVWDRVLIILIILVLGVFLWESIRRKHLGWGDRLLWLFTVILLGPIGLALFWFTTRQPKYEGKSTSFWIQALVVATLSVTAIMTAGFLADLANNLLQGFDFRLRLAQAYLAAFIGGGLIINLARRTFRTSLSAYILVANANWVFAMLLPLLVEQLLRRYGWAVYLTNALVSITVTFPLVWWLMRRNYQRWVLGEHREITVPPPERFPIPLAAGMLVMSFALAFGSVVLMLKLYTGLPWREVVLLLRGIN